LLFNKNYIFSLQLVNNKFKKLDVHETDCQGMREGLGRNHITKHAQQV